MLTSQHGGHDALSIIKDYQGHNTLSCASQNRDQQYVVISRWNYVNNAQYYILYYRFPFRCIPAFIGSNVPAKAPNNIIPISKTTEIHPLRKPIKRAVKSRANSMTPSPISAYRNLFSLTFFAIRNAQMIADNARHIFAVTSLRRNRILYFSLNNDDASIKRIKITAEMHPQTTVIR